uniref:Uncharacterized protein n=1 Tax=Aegilops tauschii subsp. strangulata TaxID=200361 RepID=A0A453JNL3_AEGTS
MYGSCNLHIHNSEAIELQSAHNPHRVVHLSVPFRGTHLVDSGEIYYLYLRSSKLKELRWEGYFKIWCCLHVLAACIFLGDVLLADEQII